MKNMDGRAQGTTLRLPRGYPEATLGGERGEWVALAGNKGRFAQPTIRFPILGINDNMLVIVWGLGVLRGRYGGDTGRGAGGWRWPRGGEVRPGRPVKRAS